jgi:hypothetical protein
MNMVNQTMKFDVGRILDPSVVSKWIWWKGMIIRFTFVEGIILKNYRINLMLKILKSSYLNLNIYKGFQLICIVMLMDGG